VTPIDEPDDTPTPSGEPEKTEYPNYWDELMTRIAPQFDSPKPEAFRVFGGIS
jgi:hypothetical protein